MNQVDERHFNFADKWNTFVSGSAKLPISRKQKNFAIESANLAYFTKRFNFTVPFLD